MQLVFRAGVLLLGSLTIVAQTLTVVPSRAMLDESPAIRLAGLAAGERATIHAGLTDGAGHEWQSHADIAADGAGSAEISAAALIFSMMPAGRGVALYQPMRNLAPQRISFKLSRKGGGAEAELEQLTLAPGVTTTPVRDDGLRGILFTPPGEGRHPAVLVLSGSNGGVPVRPAAWLAAHGYAALALAYFRYEDLPPLLEAIPLEYFQRALAWMTKRPEIDPQRIAVMGTSRGGELALQLGSMFPQITAVVAYVPADVRFPACCGMTHVPYAWTWQGRGLAFVPRRMLGARESVPEAAIQVERTHGPILTVSGEDDHVWHSVAMSESVMARLKRAHFPYRFENLKYAHAGHAAGRPSIQPAWHGAMRHPVSGNEMDLGGSPKGDAESTMDAIPKVLGFLADAWKNTEEHNSAADKRR